MSFALQNRDVQQKTPNFLIHCVMHERTITWPSLSSIDDGELTSDIFISLFTKPLLEINYAIGYKQWTILSRSRCHSQRVWAGCAQSYVLSPKTSGPLFARFCDLQQKNEYRPVPSESSASVLQARRAGCVREIALFLLASFYGPYHNPFQNTLSGS